MKQTEPEAPEAVLTDGEKMQAIEAILFASGDPVPCEKICGVLSLSKKQLGALIDAMLPKYEGRGITLIRVGEALQLCTQEECRWAVRQALGIRGGTLSASMMEVLAIVAYNQPVTRAFIEQVRGVDCSYAIGALTEKGLIGCVGRLEVPGRPLLYGTTDGFLRSFGISDLSELPPSGLTEQTAEQPL